MTVFFFFWETVDFVTPIRRPSSRPSIQHSVWYIHVLIRPCCMMYNADSLQSPWPPAYNACASICNVHISQSSYAQQPQVDLKDLQVPFRVILHTYGYFKLVRCECFVACSFCIDDHFRFHCAPTSYSPAAVQVHDISACCTGDADAVNGNPGFLLYEPMKWHACVCSYSIADSSEHALHTACRSSAPKLITGLHMILSDWDLLH